MNNDTDDKARFVLNLGGETPDVYFDNVVLKEYVPEPVLTLKSPTGGEEWIVDSKHNITWSFEHVDNVNIYYQTETNGNWIEIATNVQASKTKYSWTVPNTPSESCKVKIVPSDDETVVDESDVFSIKAPSAVENKEIPTEFALEQNYPNPFNPSTTLKYTLPRSGLVSLKVYDVLGSEVAVLVNGEQIAGYHSIEFNASEFSSGVYFAVLESGADKQIVKMLFAK